MTTHVTAHLAGTTTTAQSPSWLAQVCGWEFRRLGANRSNWMIAVGVFALYTFVLFIARDQFVFDVPGPGGTTTRVLIPLTSAAGLVNILPFLPLFFGMFLPFINADRVTRDVKRRTSELLLTTPMPTWAYLWGRYLYGLAASVGLVILGLLAVLAAGILQRLTQGSAYPMPDVHAAVLLWSVIVLPPTVLLSGLSFALGTVLPRYSNAVKAAILTAWLASFITLSKLLWSGSKNVWDPTSVAWLNEHIAPQLARAAAQGPAALLHQAAQLPDLHPLIVPRLVWMATGLVVVCLATLLYRRMPR